MYNEEDASARGGGYWFWKPPLILHHLNELKQNDFLVYSDVDVKDVAQLMPGFIDKMIRDGTDFAIKHMDEAVYLERRWTKADIYEYYYGNNATVKLKEDNSTQYSANFMVFRKCEWSLKFIQQWLHAVSNFHLVSDEESILENDEDFEDNRHDQSMLSMLLKSKYPQKEATKKLMAKCCKWNSCEKMRGQPGYIYAM